MTQNNVGIYASQISGHLYGGPYGAYDSLATVTVPSGGVSSVTFAGIPSGYKHLQIRLIARSTRSDQNGSFANVTFNSDTASNYAWHFLTGNGSSVTTVNRASQTAIEVDRWSTSLVTSGVFGTTVIDILDYANLYKNKTLRYLGGYDGNGNGEVYLGSGVWFNSSTAISSITLTEGSGSFTQYSQFALYGMK